MGLIGTLIIGAIAGWLAGQIMSGRGFGIVGNMALGILGAFVAGMVLPAVGLGGEGTGVTLVRATIGAVAILALVQLVKKA
ncbi:MAG: GlsB/YeaQ/YmgE family stress response membrane protein [Rhodobacteraceae bacterium]|jgi:uncharacterized membrane protein YeaQ/YmgE (transglycosylase-associated protein family)|nr:GlsB/YeaQ/YmgE family stress response membrane protein [Paracoccaceae bacterium]